jgi:hypothetical protein
LFWLLGDDLYSVTASEQCMFAIVSYAIDLQFPPVDMILQAHVQILGFGIAGASSSAPPSALQESAASWDTLARQIPAQLESQPAGLEGVHLHDYQMHGLRWLLGLHDLGLHGILADDMGAVSLSGITMMLV